MNNGFNLEEMSLEQLCDERRKLELAAQDPTRHISPILLKCHIEMYNTAISLAQKRQEITQQQSHSQASATASSHKALEQFKANDKNKHFASNSALTHLDTSIHHVSSHPLPLSTSRQSFFDADSDNIHYSSSSASTHLDTPSNHVSLLPSDVLCKQLRESQKQLEESKNLSGMLLKEYKSSTAILATYEKEIRKLRTALKTNNEELEKLTMCFKSFEKNESPLSQYKQKISFLNRLLCYLPCSMCK
jgi:hypothetical protein